MLWLPPRKETAQSSVPANTGKRRQLKIPSFCAILKESIGRAVRPAYNNAAAVRPQEKMRRESASPIPWKNCWRNSSHGLRCGRSAAGKRSGNRLCRFPRRIAPRFFIKIEKRPFGRGKRGAGIGFADSLEESLRDSSLRLKSGRSAAGKRKHGQTENSA